MSSLVENNNLVSWQNETISDRFSKIASQYPNHTAIKSGSSSLTYKELDEASNQLANLINIKIGLTPQSIALYLRGNLDTLTSLLAVIKAGHFYSALSRKDAPTQTRELLLDLRPRLLITDEISLPQVKEIVPAGCDILLISEYQNQSIDEIQTKQNIKTILGIFYTSGSTGTPKGVMRTQEYVLHRVAVDVGDYGIGPRDRLLYMRQFNVSSSLSSIFDTLLTGATLVIFDPELQGIGKLASVITDENITIFTPPIELFRGYYRRQPSFSFHTMCHPGRGCFI
jgi:acyl-coenzyme A synthetase/AMP-(fatty) acid ligase